MTVVLRLDSNAVSTIIADDNDFKLELQRAVIAEIVNRMHTDYLQEEIRKIIHDEVVSQQSSAFTAIKEDSSIRKLVDERLSSLVQSVRSGVYGFTNQKELSPTAKQLVDTAVRGIIQEELDKRVDRIPKQIERIQTEMETNIKTAMEEKLQGWVRINVKEWGRKVLEEGIVAGMKAKAMEFFGKA